MPIGRARICHAASPMSDPTPRFTISRRRLLIGALVVLVPVVPILVVLLLTTGATSPTATAARVRTAAFNPVTRSAPKARHRAAKAKPTATITLPSGHGALVGFLTRREAIAGTPGGHTYATLPLKTGFGTPESVLVRKVRGRWLGVINVAAGNHHLGWISSRHVELTRVNWSLHAVLSRHELYVYHGGRLTRHYLIADGKPTAPTPTGTFAVTDRLSTGDAEGPYGCCILALSAQAPHAISDWDGGNRIAIHSYPITSTIGQSVSHGCMHVTDAEGQWLLTHVPVGTPVVVSSA